MIGKVKWFDKKKGYGFILSDGKDYFAHFNEIKSNDVRKVLNTNDSVKFEPKLSTKGVVATQIIVQI